jgi:hypothetical protein
MISRIVSWLIYLILPLFTMAQEQTPQTGKNARLLITSTHDFELTGDGSAQPWQKIPWIDLPQRGKSAVAYETKVKLLYSEKGIYALYWCEDDQITATLTSHQADLYNEDVVEIFFWTDENHSLYFEYELSPLNYELVLMVPNMNGRFLGWIPWHYEGSRLARHATQIVKEGERTKGWYAEFFIPFELLTPLNNVPPVKGTTWRVNMYRIDYDQGTAAWSWQPTRVNFHDIESFGTLEFD